MIQNNIDIIIEKIFLTEKMINCGLTFSQKYVLDNFFKGNKERMSSYFPKTL